MYVKPGSHETKLIREPDGTITMCVAAPPSKGKANREIVKWLSRKLNISSSNVRMVAGVYSHLKVLQIVGIDESELQQKLEL